MDDETIAGRPDMKPGLRLPGFSAMDTETQATRPAGRPMLDLSVSLSQSFEVSPDGTFKAQGYEINSDGIKQSPVKIETKDGKLSGSDFLQIKAVGKGACGSVYKAVYLPNCRVVALKSVDVGEKDKRRQLLRELGIMSSLQCDNIIQLFGAFYDHDASKITLVLEYMDRSSLLDVLKATGPFPEDVVGLVALQAFRGLAYLHSKHHVHRDIKPGNLVINRHGSVKVADFGILTELATGVMATTRVGTTLYMSPERIQSQPYGPPSDIWSMGITLYTLAVGQPPFDSKQGLFGLISSITQGEPPTLPGDKFSKGLASLIKVCCFKDPSQRWSAEQLLEHPFLKAAQTSESTIRAKLSESLHRLGSDLSDADLAKLSKALVERFYPVGSAAYRRSLFDVARFERLGQELGVPHTAVQSAFEACYQEEMRRRAPSAGTQ